MTHHSFNQNLAAISADFHTHELYSQFYDRFGKLIDGFVGNYDVCMGMAGALTEWEYSNGGATAYEDGGVIWIEVVENFVQEMLAHSLQSGGLLDPAVALSETQAIKNAREAVRITRETNRETLQALRRVRDHLFDRGMDVPDFVSEAIAKNEGAAP